MVKRTNIARINVYAILTDKIIKKKPIKNKVKVTPNF